MEFINLKLLRIIISVRILYEGVVWIFINIGEEGISGSLSGCRWGACGSIGPGESGYARLFGFGRICTTDLIVYFFYGTH